VKLLAAVMFVPAVALADAPAEEIKIERRAEIKRPPIKDTQLEDLLIRLDTYIQRIKPGDHRLEDRTVDTLTEW
jgi:hypothetical protein